MTEEQIVREIRSKNWLRQPFVETLREHGVALALIDQSWVPRPWEFKEQIDLITADFTYVRLLGDRKVIEQQIGTWNTVIVDRSQELSEWVKFCRPIVGAASGPIFTATITMQGSLQRPSNYSVNCGAIKGCRN